MKLINAIEESCDALYVACEEVEQAIKLTGLSDEVLQDELDHTPMNNEANRNRYHNLKSLLDALYESESEIEKEQKRLCDLLKSQNEILLRLERDFVNVPELELY